MKGLKETTTVFNEVYNKSKIAVYYLYRCVS